jgi:hypothetical protein
MAHILTDEDILAGMARGMEDMAQHESDAVNKCIVYERTYRDLMAINGEYQSNMSYD